MALDQEIIDGFKQETTALLKEAESFTAKLEDASTDEDRNQCLNEVAIRFDRMMGAANTIAMMDNGYASLKKIGEVAALCKLIGYKTVEKNASAIAPLVCAFYLDAIEIVHELLGGIDANDKISKEAEKLYDVLQKRMGVLADHLKAA